MPASVLQVLVAFMLWRAVFPWERRRGMWVTVAHVVVAPFGRCTFRDTFVGDVMTSLVKVFTDLAYTFCFLGTGEFLKLAPGIDSSITSDRCSDAPAYTQVFSPIIHAAPLVRCDRAAACLHKQHPNARLQWFRMLQNVRR